jgi:hypothetical protein
MALTALVSQGTYWTRPVKHQWRQAVQHVEARLGPEDVLLFDTDFNETSYAHYAHAAAPRLRLVDAPPGAPPDRVYGVSAAGAAPANLAEQIATRGRAWLVLSDARPAEVARARAFFAGWVPAGSAHFRGIDLELYARGAAAARGSAR